MVHSLITLFPPEATVFDTNGLGSLSEAVSCVVTEERNGSFELEMVYPITGRHYNDIKNRSILYVKPNPVDSPQAFRIYAYTKPMDGLVTYQAAHISYDLAGYPVKPFVATSSGVAFQNFRTYAVLSHPFYFQTTVATGGILKIDTPTPIRSIMGGSENSVLEVFGGEYKFDNFKVQLFSKRGSNRGVVIRYGKNLVDIKQEENISDLYTDILPYWYGDIDGVKTLVTLPELTIGMENPYYNNFHKILTVDLSSNFSERPFVTDLRDAANTWIKANNPNVPVTSFDISFAQLEQTEEYKNLTLLERVELCDEVTVEYSDFGISATAKVIKTVYNVLTGSYDSVTLGDARSTLSGTVGSFNSSLNGAIDSFNKALDNTKSELEQATEEATNWITNGRGYMVAVKNEIGQWMELCSLDNPDITKAVQVWRWNNGGFGHSSRGYNGPYEVAITQDGKINASFIVTGILSANLIRTGNLYLGGNSYGNIVLYRHDDATGIDEEYGNIGSRTNINTIRCKEYVDFANLDAYYESHIVFQDHLVMPYTLYFNENLNQLDNNAEMHYGDGYLTLSGVDAEDVITDGPFYGLIVNTYGKGMYVDTFYSSQSARSISLSKSYGQRVMDSTYSTSSMIEDTGEGETDEYGKCYVYFDDVFLEAVSTNVEYQVFLQKEGSGDIWVSEKAVQYFVVEGTENLKFSWIAKVKRKGNEYDRLSNYQVAEIKEIDYEDAYYNESKKLIKASIEKKDNDQIKDLESIIKEKEETIDEAIE